MGLLWRVAARTDRRIEPIAVGQRPFERDDKSAIIAIARRDGLVATPLSLMITEEGRRPPSPLSFFVMNSRFVIQSSCLTALLVTIVLLVGCTASSLSTPRAGPESAAPTTRSPAPREVVAPSVTPATTPAGPLQFDGAEALALAQAQCDIGPRPAGSEALLRTRDFIKSQLEPYGWSVMEQDFTYRNVPIHNLVAVKGEGRPLMVGAHFDTRPRADHDPQHPDQPIIGGNDGASGVAVLLELGRTLEIPQGRQVQLAFFDAEDRGNIDSWPFSVGANYMAANLPAARPEAVVVVDMIGDADQQIYREQNSNQALNDTIFAIAAQLGYEGQGFYDKPGYTIIDDHLPFLQQGIPAVDLIDFDYPAWHTLADTCDQLGAPSLERVGRVLEHWLEQPPTQSFLPLVMNASLAYRTGP